MKAEFSKESYALVEKLAYKFAYSTDSIEYDRYVSVGIEGLNKAIATFKNDGKAQFSTYANTCIKNAMCTERERIGRFDLQQDDNVVMEDLNELSSEKADGNLEKMEKMAESIIRRVTNSDRNTEMLMLHLGIKTDEPMDYKEIGTIFNVSAERVRQVCVSSLNAIRKDSKAQILYSFVA